jgi:predicted nucleotidyltransferase
MAASAEDPIARFRDACAADERISAAFVGGSVARDEADRYSDLDLCVVVPDASFDDVFTDRAAIVAKLGTPLFVEDWGDEAPEVFVMLADGTDVEINFVRESRLTRIEVGPIRSLVDRRGLLDGLELPIRSPSREDLAAELCQTLAWFWHDVGHFITAAGRSEIWWAAGQIEALRGYCVNLVREAQGVRKETEPFWKIDADASTDALEELRSTFVGPDLDAMIAAARELVAFFGAHGRRAALAYAVEYPEELEGLLRRRLDDLVATRRSHPPG